MPVLLLWGSILGDSRKNVIIIPIRAVFSNDNNEDIVYLMPSQATAAKAQKGKTPAQAPKPIATPVKLGANDMQMVEVISGLKEGDRISLAEPDQKPSFPGMM